MNPIQNLQRALPADVDAALIFSEHNRRYLTGFPSTDGILFVTRQRAVLLIDFRYIEAARAGAAGCEVVLLNRRRAQLGELLRECGVKTVGVEAREISLADFARLKEEFETVKFDPSTALNDAVLRLRQIKSEEEIANIRAAQRITDLAFDHILSFIRPGAREADLALEIEYFMRKNGASGPSFDLIVVSGENSSRPHGVPGERAVCPGDFVTMDIGAVVNGYCSDMTRTVAVGGVSSAMRHVYDTVLRAQREALAAIRAGADCGEIDRLARSIIDGAGYRGCFGHGLGHSVGIEIHEEPRLSPGCKEPLAPGMLMTVEPGVYLEGRFGVRIEDLVVVTETGCDDLTASPKELLIL